MIKDAIAKTIRREDLTQTEAEAAMMDIMTGNATQAQIGAYLIALRMKGETVDEITGFGAGDARERGAGAGEDGRHAV